MALGSSNTYSTPVSTLSISLARTNWNNSIRAVLQNFASDAAPTSVNLTLEGSATSPVTGMFFHSTQTNRVYIFDAEAEKGNPVYGSSWTRNGIGHTVKDAIGDVVNDIANTEIGELTVTVGANARLYTKTTNAGAIIDVGIPPADSITNTMLKSGSVTQDKVGSGIAKTNEAQSLTGTQTISRTGQITYLTAAALLTATSGNVHLGLDAIGTSNASIKHVSGNSGVEIVGENGVDQAPLSASRILEAGANLVPVGGIMSYGAASQPDGWFLCNGQAVSRTVYADLFSVLSTTYGAGDESTTFNVPDFSARFPLGDDGTLVLGAQHGTYPAANVTSGSSGEHDHYPSSNTTVVASAKDSTTTSVLSADGILSEGAHTHNVVVPHVVVNFIIKH